MRRGGAPRLRLTCRDAAAAVVGALFAAALLRGISHWTLLATPPPRDVPRITSRCVPIGRISRTELTPISMHRRSYGTSAGWRAASSRGAVRGSAASARAASAGGDYDAAADEAAWAAAAEAARSGVSGDAADAVDDWRWSPAARAGPGAPELSVDGRTLYGAALATRLAVPLDPVHAASTPQPDARAAVADLDALPRPASCALRDAAGNAPRTLLFGRVGKSGSESVAAWLRARRRRGRYTFTDLGNHEHLSLAGEAEHVARMMQHKRSGFAAVQRQAGRDAVGGADADGAAGAVPPAPRALVVDHVFYLNFSRYGQPSPAAFTVLRDPVARYASQWAFWRAPAVLGAALRGARNASLAQCAAAALDSAEPRLGCPPANYAVRYLCGHGPPCADPPDEASFRQAAAHLARAYALVGVTERLDATLATLQRMLPPWFARADGRPDAHAQRINVQRDAARAEASKQLTPEVAAQLREANALDWRLYVLARALLERQEAACAAEEAAGANKGR